MPANLPLELREEFRQPHMRGTAIELRNRQGTGWTQRDPAELLRITYPTADVQRALAGISTGPKADPSCFSVSVDAVNPTSWRCSIMPSNHRIRSGGWAKEWGAKPGFASLAKLVFPKGFVAITETLSNQEYQTLWDLIFDRHPKGAFYRGKASGTLIPAKSLMQDLFAERPTALILDEFQTWFDGLHDEPGNNGLKRRQWAFNFVQILSELAKERPDLLMLIVSVRDTDTEGYRQIHRISPVVIDFKGETAKEDRKRLLLHRLFENRAQFAPTLIEQTVAAYAQERVRLIHSNKSDPEKDRLRAKSPTPGHSRQTSSTLLEDHILMADSAQDKRDLIRVLAELYRSRGAQVPILTPSDFLVDDDQCGVLTLLDSFATTADQEHLREKAIRNLEALQAAGIQAPHAREAISGIWIRSLSPSNIVGGTREELQLDLTRAKAIDDNAFTAELASVVEHSFNIHEVGTSDKRFCFKLEENPLSKVKATAKNDKLFEPDGPTANGLLPVLKDQAFIRQVLEHQLRSPDAVSEPPSRVIVLDPNWETAPWANVPVQDQPERWDKPVLLGTSDIACRCQRHLGAVAGEECRLPAAIWFDSCCPRPHSVASMTTPTCAGSPAVPFSPRIGKKNRTAMFTTIFSAGSTKISAANWANDSTVMPCCIGGIIKRPVHVFSISNLVRPRRTRWPKPLKTACGPNFFAPEDFEAFMIAAAQRGDTMKQVLAQLREPPAKPDQDSIPYLGDLMILEQMIRVAAKDRIALNVGGRLVRAEPAKPKTRHSSVSSDPASRRVANWKKSNLVTVIKSVVAAWQFHRRPKAACSSLRHLPEHAHDPASHSAHTRAADPATAIPRQSLH